MTKTLDPLDELTSMFLTGPEDGGAAATAASTTIEILLVGHLPVRAGLWLTPYADARAREQGPAALVRLDGDEPMVQLVRVDEADVPGLASCRSLRETILQLAGVVRTWMVRPSTRQEVVDLLAAIPSPAAGSTRLTILSSADQAALVNAYRLVKTVVEGWPTTGGVSGAARPEMGLAVIGADDASARRVASQLDETTRSCLETPVPLVAHLPRMDAGIRAGWLRSFLGRGRPELHEVLGWIDAARRHPGAPSPDTAPTAEEPTVAASEPPAPPAVPERPAMPTSTAPPPVEPRPAAPSSPSSPPPPAPAGPGPDRSPSEPAPVREIAAEIAGRPVAEPEAPPAPAVKLAPKAGVEVEPKAALDAREPDEHGRPVPLARYVDGLEPIVPRCPRHERVELAVDAAGAIHLLAREDAVRELAVVAGWARAHRELIAMACPDQTFVPSAPMTLHLFAASPLAIADLHGSDMRLHVLAPVDVDGRRGWYTAPLNDPGR